jgi:hypothetical protein
MARTATAHCIQRLQHNLLLVKPTAFKTYSFQSQRLNYAATAFETYSFLTANQYNNNLLQQPIV